MNRSILDCKESLAADHKREEEALEWGNAIIGDVKNETR